MRLCLTVLAAMGLLIAVLVLSNRSLQHDLDGTRQKLAALNTRLHQQDQVISNLNQQMRQREKAELALREDLGNARQAMHVREQQQQRSLHDNPQSRLWADTVLPADINRLHERPAFSSSGDYLRWLSGGQLMPSSVKPSENK